MYLQAGIDFAQLNETTIKRDTKTSTQPGQLEIAVGTFKTGRKWGPTFCFAVCS